MIGRRTCESAVRKVQHEKFGCVLSGVASGLLLLYKCGRMTKTVCTFDFYTTRADNHPAHMTVQQRFLFVLPVSSLQTTPLS
jgi:hypothetical protein